MSLCNFAMKLYHLKQAVSHLEVLSGPGELSAVFGESVVFCLAGFSSPESLFIKKKKKTGKYNIQLSFEMHWDITNQTWSPT